MKNLRAEIEKILFTLDLGYKWQMSDYATSKMEEEEYEKQGIKQVSEVSDKLLDLFSKYIEGMEAMKFEQNAAINGEPAQDMYDDIRNQLRKQIKDELKISKE